MNTHVQNLNNQNKSKPLVWVIDDILEQQELLVAKLEFADYRTLGFASHRSAADKLGGQSEVPQVIFCDYETEAGYSADWFMKRLKEAGWHKKTRVIATSGSDALNEKLLNFGAQSSIPPRELRQIMFDDFMSVAAEKLKGYIGSVVGHSESVGRTSR